MKIALLADLHFGRIAGPEIVSALVRDIREQDVNLVVLAGDLTQRARPREFRAAVRFIERLQVPVVAVPGNHDVYPWWHLVPRLWFPLRRFHRWITPQRFPVVEVPGVVMLGINSATGRRIQRGFVDTRAIGRMRELFQSCGTCVLTVLVVHHPPWGEAGSQPLFADSGTDAVPDMVLCGHAHVSWSGIRHMSGRPVVIVQAGTATSHRWREPQMGVNSYQMVTIADTMVSVEERRFVLSAQAFGPHGHFMFTRDSNRVWVKGGHMDAAPTCI